ncbi:hypothetical protein Tco_0431753 [Tanacetum coccineum]
MLSEASPVLGFPSISPIVIMAEVGPLSGKAACDRSASVLLHPGRGQLRPRPKGLLYPLYVIKSPQSSIFTACGAVLRAINITRLWSFSAVPLPSSVIVGSPRLFFSQLDSTQGRVIPLPNKDDHGDQNENTESLNEEGGNAEQENRFEEDDRVGQDDNIVVDDDVQAAVADKPKGIRKKREATGGASGSNHPPKKLSTLNVKVGVATVATVPFVTSSVTPTLEREGGGNTDSIYGPNLHTQHPFERFVISSDSSHHSSTNYADDEVASLVRSSVLLLPVMIAVVATTAVADISFAPVLGAGASPIH